MTYAAIPTADDTNWDAATADWSANGYRLPTEMEYMWAAMGATSDGISADIVGGVNTGGYTKGYAGSIETGGAQVNIGNYVWYATNSGSTTHPVGTKLPNELGLYDMSGNVWEWCWDWYSSYPAGTQADYRGAASGTLRVVRGGSWYYFASFATVAISLQHQPELFSTAVSGSGLFAPEFCMSMPRFPLALKALSRKCLRESLVGGSGVSRFKLKLGYDMFHREAIDFFWNGNQ